MNETTTQEIVDTILAAGLDHHDFRCETAARYATETQATNLWACIAEFPRTRRAEIQDRAWELAGEPNPYADAA